MLDDRVEALRGTTEKRRKRIERCPSKKGFKGEDGERGEEDFVSGISALRKGNSLGSLCLVEGGELKKLNVALVCCPDSGLRQRGKTKSPS